MLQSSHKGLGTLIVLNVLTMLTPKRTNIEPKTPFLNVSLDAPKIDFRIFLFCNFFLTKSENCVFESLKIINFPILIKPTFVLDMFSHWFDSTDIKTAGNQVPMVLVARLSLFGVRNLQQMSSTDAL